jgi:DNA-binding NarL/FixJ family response regulator
LNGYPQIDVVATIAFGDELEPTLAKYGPDVLLLDIGVPTSQENPNPYPILHAIPKLLQMYSELNLLVVSMYAERGLIRAVIDAGASGYVLKDDQATIRDLGNILLSIASGGIYFSQKAHQLLLTQKTVPSGERLSNRELEALSLCAAYPNWTTADLARKMTVTNSTVRNLLSGAYLKLSVHTRAAAIARARQLGLITPDAPTPQR